MICVICLRDKVLVWSHFENLKARIVVNIEQDMCYRILCMIPVLFASTLKKCFISNLSRMYVIIGFDIDID